MILYRFLILGFLLLFISHIHVKAQHQELQEKPGIWKSASENTPDSNTIAERIPARKLQRTLPIFFYGHG
jgi:hypothetical protein